MRYVTKIPEEDKEYTEKLLNDGWKRLKEPKNIYRAMLYALPLAFVIAILMLFYYSFLYNFFEKKYGENITYFSNLTDIIAFFLLFLISAIIFSIIYVFLGLVFLPNFLHSEKTYWGMRWTYFFAGTKEKMTKKRRIIVSIMPFIILGVIFPTILIMCGVFDFFWFVLCLSISASSYVSIFNTLLIVFQVPKNAMLVNNGYFTFFKVEE